jgi:uncharacterized protein (DUF58 family)
VLDNSASMKFANKIEYARHLTACLAYLLASQQDLAGLAAVDESVKVELAPGSAPSHLDRLFRALEASNPAREPICPRTCTDWPSDCPAAVS